MLFMLVNNVVHGCWNEFFRTGMIYHVPTTMIKTVGSTGMNNVVAPCLNNTVRLTMLLKHDINAVQELKTTRTKFKLTTERLQLDRITVFYTLFLSIPPRPVCNFRNE